MNANRNVAVLMMFLVSTSIPASAKERHAPSTFQKIEIAWTADDTALEPVMGERMAAQIPGPTSHMTGKHPSLRAWLIAGAAIGAFIIWMYASGLNRI